MTDRSRPSGASDEHTLPGGNVGGAVRVGDTVRRPSGPWTPAVHDLLRHLAAAGLDAIPDVRGFDDQGREILGFLPGRSVDVDAEVVSDALLAAAVRWVRRFHDAVATYRPPGPVRWRNTTRALEPGEIICHHDAGAYNWIVDGNDLVGVIDWDMAGPGRPIDDLAFMAWNSLPLYREIPIDDVLRRLRLMAEAYRGGSAGSPSSFGWSEPVSPRAILAHVDARMTSAADRIEAGQRAGDPGMLNLAAVGEPDRTRRRLAALRERIVVIEARLES
ncbi:MAG TPA: phosphotransferase [Jiangellaceae bacterium]